MASLQTLRNKGGVIVAVIIGIALLAFVLGDMLSSGSALFGGNNSNIGKIDGTTITSEQYSSQITTLTEVRKVALNSETITDEQSQAIQEEAWEQLVLRYAVTPQLSQVGISVGVDEMTELLSGRFVSPVMQQLFANPQTGMFEAANLHAFLGQIDQDPTGRLQLFWSNIQNDVQNQARIMKYKTLVDKGIYVTSQQAQFITSLEEKNYSVRFVADRLSSISDSTITVTDAELKAYYDSHLPMFERVVSREIDYVVFDALPSAADYKAAAKYMTELKAEFETTANVKQFASLNSQSPFDSRYYKEGELTGELGTFAFTATTADIYAPDIMGDEYTLARISDVKILPDSVKFSHIVVAPDNQKLADSLLKVLTTDKAFAEAATVYSLDQQSADNGGQVGAMDPQTLAAEFAEPLLATPKGGMTLVATPQAIHIIRVNDRIGESRKVQLGTIKYAVEASEATRSIAFNRASTFANESSKTGFAKLAKDSMLSVRQSTLSPSQREMQGFKGSREIVRWTYNAKNGDNSSVMEFGNSFVVASLTAINDEGTTPMDKVKAEIKTIVIQHKKADMIAQKMAGGSVDELSTRLSLPVVDANDVSFATYIVPEIGMDAAFAGGVCAIGEGQTSKPIKGRMAVYVAQVVGAINNPISVAMVRERVVAEQEQSAFYKAYQTLIKTSKIEDQRYKFF